MRPTGDDDGAGPSSETGVAARPKKKSARELAGEGARVGLQTTAVDELFEYTLAMGSGSGEPGVIEDEGLAQRSTAARQGRLSAAHL